MKNVLKRFPDALIRLVIAFAVLLGTVFLVVRFAIPLPYKSLEVQWASTIKQEKAKEIRFAGEVACADCHEDVTREKRGGYHRDLSCETCHGPAKAHADDPDAFKPPSPRDRKFCPVCHTFNPSRPLGFPQINPVAHNPMKPCVTCHQPHDPKPPKVPAECAACHGEIARMKAVSHHVTLECTTCHRTPARHKVSPRTSKPDKPSTREFCGRCHGEGSGARGVPKVDIATHGEKYVCWQCHYPHLPEV
jgi:DnaJ-class molecular chaperone